MNPHDADWYVNGGLRIDLREVTAARVVDEGNRTMLHVFLRGVSEPLHLQCASLGASDFLSKFDRCRRGEP